MMSVAQTHRNAAKKVALPHAGLARGMQTDAGIRKVGRRISARKGQKTKAANRAAAAGRKAREEGAAAGRRLGERLRNG